MLREETDPLFTATPSPGSGHSSATPRPRGINLTEQLAMEEAEAILASCNDPLYQQLFAVPSERQRLMRYAMNRVGNIFVMAGEPPILAQHRARLEAQRPEIHKALYEGMQLLAELYSDGIYR